MIFHLHSLFRQHLSPWKPFLGSWKSNGTEEEAPHRAQGSSLRNMESTISQRTLIKHLRCPSSQGATVSALLELALW